MKFSICFSVFSTNAVSLWQKIVRVYVLVRVDSVLCAIWKSSESEWHQASFQAVNVLVCQIRQHSVQEESEIKMFVML